MTDRRIMAPTTSVLQIQIGSLPTTYLSSLLKEKEPAYLWIIATWKSSYPGYMFTFKLETQIQNIYMLTKCLTSQQQNQPGVTKERKLQNGNECTD